MKCKKLLRVAALLSIFSILLSGLNASAQNKPISGRVVDSAGQPVMDAYVTVVGNIRVSTITSMDGTFAFTVPTGATISVECMGYITKTFTVTADRSVYDIMLEDDLQLLEETVVIGYGSQKKADLTGSVVALALEDFRNLSTTDAAGALQGKAPGVHVINNGAPGSGSDIRVRGYSSNGGDLAPLYIVDGLQVPSIQYLDPTMIMSIDILKDAASAAIYGAQAGNGVVIITTKTGVDGRPVVTFKSKATMQSFARRPQMNREELLTYLGYEYGDSWVAKNLADYDYDHEDYPNGVIDQDWISAYIEPSWTQQHSVTFSGGNHAGHYYASLNYVHEDGVVRGDKDVYKRFTAQINADYRIFRWLQIGSNNSIEKWNTKSVSQRGYSSSFELMLLMDPLTPIYWKSVSEMSSDVRQMYDRVMSGDASVPKYRFLGDEKGWYANTKYSDTEGSPLARRDATDSESGGFNINGIFFANVTPFRGFTFTSRFGYRISQDMSHSYTAPFYIGRGSQDNYTISATPNQGFYYQWENYFNYDLNVRDHDLTIMAGMSYRQENTDNVTASSTGADILTSYEDQFHYLEYVKAEASKTIRNLPSKTASLAYFGRLTYSYDNRYSFQANFRADAFDSSKLPKNNRWGFFPSFSAGWTISNEAFFRNNVDRHIINALKIRGSWGRNGNISVLNGYRYATNIAVGNNWYQYDPDSIDAVLASAPDYSNGLPNPDLRWETSEQWDAGLDAGFFDNRLTFTADYFNKQTKDLLFNVTVPVELGASSSTVNGGRVLNTGWEFDLQWRDSRRDFDYFIKANFSTLQNKVLELANGAARITSSDGSSTNYKIQTAFEPGYPVWYLLGYVYEGIDSEGEPIYTDLNGDGHISSDDMTYIGQGTPKFTYGVTINLAWKGFDFTLYGAGIGGNSIVPMLHRTGFKNNLRVYLEQANTDENPDGPLPNPAMIVAPDDPFWSSTGNTFRGDFFRIKQLQLGYSLPQSILRRTPLTEVRIYASLDDFFTFTSYPGLDPETASVNNTTGTGLDWGSYPTMRKVIFGLNLTF